MMMAAENQRNIQKINKKEWINHNNNTFYETIKASGLKRFAIKGGLASGCDIELLTPYWQKAHSILEIGAGYGRVMDYLFKGGFSGKITAIERCDAMFDYLQTHYANHNQVKLFQDDINNLDEENNLLGQFDLILWLWSGIADFSPLEQSIILQKLNNFLTKGGILIFDTMAENAIPLGTEERDIRIHYTLKADEATIHMHRTPIPQLKEYAKEAGFSKLKHIPYHTTTNRERLLHVLS